MGGKSEYFLQIDILKGLAMISIIVIHSLYIHYSTYLNLLALFTISQAVPLFLLIMGINMAHSFKRRGYADLKQIFSKNYVISRFKRLYFPFVITVILSLIVAFLFNKHFYWGGLVLIGQIPLAGYGDYFIYLVLQFVVVFPFLYVLYKWNPRVMLVLSFIINLLFDSMVYIQSLHGYNVSYHFSCILGYIFLPALGLWISERLDFHNPRFKTIFDTNKNILILGLIISLGSLIFFVLFEGLIPQMVPGVFVRLFTSFYPLFLFVVGMKYLPSISNNRIAGFLSLIGKASYHIFLIQIVLFMGGLTFGPGNGSYLVELIDILSNLVICVSIGLLFFIVEGRLYNAVMALRGSKVETKVSSD